MNSKWEEPNGKNKRPARPESANIGGKERKMFIDLQSPRMESSRRCATPGQLKNKYKFVPTVRLD